MSTAHKLKGLDVYTIVTNQIMSQLENGIIPWHASFYEAGYPQNYVTGRRYTALNTWLLASLGYKRNLFLTWKQIRDLGLSVQKGQKGHMAIYWMPGTEKKLRYYVVYNVAQTNMPVDKIPAAEQVSDAKAMCEHIIAGMPRMPVIDDWGTSLFYNPKDDIIYMPAPEFVPDYRDYYSALFYALIHSTAHPTRLNRPACMANTLLQAKQYDRSELTWAMGCSLLCSTAGIPALFLKKYSYGTDGWLQKFSTDKKMVMEAADDALRAVQYILNSPCEDTPHEETMELS